MLHFQRPNVFKKEWDMFSVLDIQLYSGLMPCPNASVPKELRSLWWVELRSELWESLLPLENKSNRRFTKGDTWCSNYESWAVRQKPKITLCCHCRRKWLQRALEEVLNRFLKLLVEFRRSCSLENTLHLLTEALLCRRLLLWPAVRHWQVLHIFGSSSLRWRHLPNGVCPKNMWISSESWWKMEWRKRRRRVSFYVLVIRSQKALHPCPKDSCVAWVSWAPVLATKLSIAMYCVLITSTRSPAWTEFWERYPCIGVKLLMGWHLLQRVLKNLSGSSSRATGKKSWLSASRWVWLRSFSLVITMDSVPVFILTVVSQYFWTSSVWSHNTL